jgi:hypothetical protein
MARRARARARPGYPRRHAPRAAVAHAPANSGCPDSPTDSKLQHTRRSGSEDAIRTVILIVRSIRSTRPAQDCPPPLR